MRVTGRHGATLRLTDGAKLEAVRCLVFLLVVSGNETRAGLVLVA